MIPPHSKSQIRETNLRKRQSIAETDRALWSQQCSERLCQAIRASTSAGAVIAGYVPVKGELDAMEVLSTLAAEKRVIALPVMGKAEGKKQLTFHVWNPGEVLTPKNYGIHEPGNLSQIVTPDIVIVPLLAFDRTGHRLGYGAGYYDAVLRKLRVIKPSFLAIGAGFSFQEEHALPAEAYDEPLAKIITEKEVITPQ